MPAIKDDVKLQVLIVDDESGMRDGAARCLKKLRVAQKDFGDFISFEIQTIGTGLEAVEAINP